MERDDPDGRSWGDWAKQDLSWILRALIGWVHCRPRPTNEFLPAVMCTSISRFPLCSAGVCLEAMAAGCCIVASDTAPVREVLTDGETGVLVDFFSPEHQANAIEALLDSKDRRRSLADAARQASGAYDCKEGLAGLDGAHVRKQ